MKEYIKIFAGLIWIEFEKAFHKHHVRNTNVPWKIIVGEFLGKSWALDIKAFEI